VHHLAIARRQVSLYQLFDGQEFRFDIPAYQRPYSWTVKQVAELLEVRSAADASSDLAAAQLPRPRRANYRSCGRYLRWLHCPWRRLENGWG
jgi:hypothetical protein